MIEAFPSDTPWQRPSKRWFTLRHVEVVASALVVLVLIAVPLFVLGLHALSIGSLVLIVLATALTDYFVQRRMRSWRYFEREDDLVVQRGLLIRRTSVIPYGRMQFIDVSAGPIERALRLATIEMHTAAAASDARIPGLPAEEAARLRDQLSSLGEARAAGL